MARGELDTAVTKVNFEALLKFQESEADGTVQDMHKQ
jgi:hypothetical protein